LGSATIIEFSTSLSLSLLLPEEGDSERVRFLEDDVAEGRSVVIEEIIILAVVGAASAL
jgi:hypothetical protein